MSQPVELVGVGTFTRTLAVAERRLEALAATNRRVAESIRAAAHPPRRTGRLAASLVASGTDTEASVSSSLVYAPVIEYGNAHVGPGRHFLASAATAQQGRALDTYTRHADESLALVRGA